MSFFSRFRTGLALPSITVALTPARAFTSRLRRRYLERYHGRYRFPVLLFAIDMTVVGLVLAIFGVGVWYAAWKPEPDSGLRLVFSAPPIVTATTLALEAKVFVQDGKTHPNVHVRWVLPPGVQVLSASPSLDDRQEAILGDLAPQDERTARLTVRVLTPPGFLRFGFQVRSNDELFSGSEVRPIVGSALHLEEKIVPVRSVGSSRILVLHNNGDTSLDCASVRASQAGLGSFAEVLVGSSGGPGSLYAAFDEVAAHDQRIFLLSASSASSVGVFCGDVEVERLTLAPALPLSSSAVGLTTFPSTPGQETVAQITATQPIQLFVYHPLLRDAEQGFRIFDIASGTTRLVLPLDAAKPVLRRPGTGPAWFALPVRRATDGYEVLGDVSVAPLTTPFRMSTEARYYATSGGQIGAGPLPPQVGETTRYWVQWKLAPTDADLSNVVVRSKLPVGVTWTGNSALPNGGEFTQEGEELVWRLPFLPSSLTDTVATFELALTPAAHMRGKTPLLLEISTAAVLENRSGITIQAKANSVDTSLLNDERAKGKGIVR